MESSEDKHWASKYLLDPLNAPEPSEETGPGTHHITTLSPSKHSPSSSQPKNEPSVTIRRAPVDQNRASTSSVHSSNPYRRSTQNTSGYPSPPPSTSPRASQFPDLDSSHPSDRNSLSQVSTQIPTSTGGGNTSTTNGSDHGQSTRSRGSSLGQRHPGDQTHRPLDMLRQDAKVANRAPHLRKKHFVGADSIDVLDNVGPGAYHHEGPYDATLLARNTSYTSSPLEAVSHTNEEALKATPREMIKDSIDKHRPLDGTAAIPPGVPDRNGRILNYEEGPDMMIEGLPEGGAFKRWPGIRYHPEDLKGKGEPSFSIERALNQHKIHRRNVSEPQNRGYAYHDAPHHRTASGSNVDAQNIEMMTSPTSASADHSSMKSALAHERQHRRPLSADGGQMVGETGTGSGAGFLERSGSAAGKLKKRFGSLKVKGRSG